MQLFGEAVLIFFFAFLGSLLGVVLGTGYAEKKRKREANDVYEAAFLGDSEN